VTSVIDLRTDRPLPGVAMMLGFCAVAPLIDVAAKMAVQSVSVGQVALLRMVVQAVLMVPVVWLLRQSLAAPRPLQALLAARAAMLIGSTLTFVAALYWMPLADALAIVFVEPFLLLALGALVFGERVGPRRILASAAGFAGALLVIQPNFAAFGWVALLPLATAAFFAVYLLLTRRIARDLAPEPMQALTALWGTALMLPLLAFGPLWAPLALAPATAQVWGWLVGVGVAATVSHLLVTYALRFAPAATLAPLHYLEIVTAVALGWWVFGDWPNPLSWTGIAVIVAAGLYIIARERTLARQARR
jgi:drug/metabolite transporter (DMT)-like permease